MATSAIIQEVMAEHNINTENVPSERHIKDFTVPSNISGSKRYFNTKGFALFHPHPNCKRKDKWGSPHSWSVMDLKTQTFRHHFRQGCKMCENKIEPHYDDEAIQKMAEWACREYQIRMKIIERPVFTARDDSVGHSNGPHDESRCGMCQELKRSCWKWLLWILRNYNAALSELI